MAPPPEFGKVFSATYSNVPVYEVFLPNGNHIMRRRADHWINATHILKVAEFDKPARTRILEREVQKGTHEKVQGGYGKYQGTWIPLEDGRALAQKHGVLEMLLPMLDFVPGDKTPPPAPKHSVAAPSKPRAPRQPVAPRRTQAQIQAQAHSQEHYNDRYQESEAPDNVTLISDAYGDDYNDAAQYTNSRKRKRMDDMLTPQEEAHQLWAEELLDYFMLLDSPDQHHRPPTPPPGVNLDRHIDDKGHTALHWAAAMGDLTVVRELIQRGASIDVVSKNGETPLMRAVIFTNSFDKQVMERLAGWLVQTVQYTDWFGATVFHQIAQTTSSKSKYSCARYYLDAILNRMAESYNPVEIEKALNIQDRNGDTAITIAARNGARKCVRAMIGRNAAVDIPNEHGETADQLIVQLNYRRRDGRHRSRLSSSPFQLDAALTGHHHANGMASFPNGLDGMGDLSGSHASFLARNANNPILLTSSPDLGGPDGRNGHASEAATFLTTQIFPMLQSKSAKLAAAYDSEIAERDAEIVELERVVKGRKEEIEGLKRGTRELVLAASAAAGEADGPSAASAGGDDEEEADRAATQRLAELSSLVEAGMEEEQARTLTTLVREEQSRGAAAVAAAGTTHDDPAESGGKEAVAARVASLMAKRRELVKDVVRNRSLAGLGERQADYRRLITGALGVRDADVEGMLGEICAELEESGAALGPGGIIGVGGAGVGGGGLASGSAVVV